MADQPRSECPQPGHGRKFMHGDTLLCMECGGLVPASPPPAPPAPAEPAAKCPICGKDGDCLTPEQRESLARGIEQATRGEVFDLGDFSQHAAEPPAALLDAAIKLCRATGNDAAADAVAALVGSHKEGGAYVPPISDEAAKGLIVILRSYIYTNYGPIGAAKEWIEKAMMGKTPAPAEPHKAGGGSADASPSPAGSPEARYRKALENIRKRCFDDSEWGVYIDRVLGDERSESVRAKPEPSQSHPKPGPERGEGGR